MIKKLELKFGANSGAPKLVIEPTAITVFVGPNNSGKSKAIAEIAAQCTAGYHVPTDVIIERVSFDGLSTDKAEEVMNFMAVDPPAGNIPLNGYTFIRHPSQQPNHLHQVSRTEFAYSLMNPNDPTKRKDFAQHYLKYKTLILNGRNRIDLVNDQPGGDMQCPPLTSFQQLFRDDELRIRYSDIINKSLDSYAVLDPTNHGQLRLRLSSEKPPSPEVERGLGQASIAFHAAAQHIATASDGAKAFAGILAEILAGNPQVLLMDEPEAFLHPALAFNLGREIARSLAKTEKRMFVSTHSPQFLMGCIQSGVPINVIRLTYRGGSATARLLPSSQIIRLMRNPLLRSVGVISALFYESVIVAESDADRAFYQEVNERLIPRGRGVANCIFLNAQNKQTIPTVIEPLRGLGIPAAAIYDVDLVKDGGGVATTFMQTVGVPPLARQGLTTTRAALANALTQANPAYKTQGGIEVLAAFNKAAANDYFDQLDAYGAFVVRYGELESWLKSLGSTGHGPNWLVSIFEKMGEDPSLPEYIEPTDDDVWAFIDKIAAWLSNPNRKGISV